MSVITVENYQENRNDINWDLVDPELSKDRSSIVDMFELAGLDKDIDKTINDFLDEVNAAYKQGSKPKDKAPAKKKVATKSKVNTKTPKAPAKKKAPATGKIKTAVNIKNVDAFSDEFKLLRRFLNATKKDVLTFRQVHLLYMAFNKAAVSRTVRKASDKADEFTKANEGIAKIFKGAKANGEDQDIQLVVENTQLIKDIEKFVSTTKVNYAVTLLRSFVGMQGTKPEVAKVKRLLTKIENGVKSERVSKDNRLYDEVTNAIKELKEYIKDPEDKIDIDPIGLSVPKGRKCSNRIKCKGLEDDGTLKKGYRFTKGGNVVSTKKKKTKKK